MTAQNNWNIPEKAARLHKAALVWDNHTCMPHDTTNAFLPELERYRALGVDVAVINIGDAESSLELQMRVVSAYRLWIKAHSDHFTLINKADDILKAKREGKLAIAFDVEGAYAMGEDISVLSLYYDLGVRWMLMAYNKGNLVGGGCHDAVDGGLTPFGYKAIAEMDRVGIIKCCSHTGYRTSMDVLTASSLPVLFSHSNPRALKDHPRNIPDELMLACARTGGVQCINGIGVFLGDADTSTETFVRHIDYAVQKIGPEHVGIGLDYVFDKEGIMEELLKRRATWPAGFGYDSTIKFMNIDQFPEITEHLLKLGYSEQNIRGILGENLLRVAKAVWK
jgi:membrane dipeptidase